MTDFALRALFITLTVEGFPTLVILTREINITSMTATYEDDTDDAKYIHLVRDFKKLLRLHNKTLEDYGLHKHPTTGQIINTTGPTELEEAMERTNAAAASAEVATLDGNYPNNAMQEQFLNTFKVRFHLLIY
jgi:hypothetical protein